MPVGRIGLSAMRLAANGFTGPARDPQLGIAVLRRAVELGVNHIDTAAFYLSDDGSLPANDLIRTALHPYPEELVIATKVGPERLPDGGVHMTTDPQALRPMVEQNLTELGVDTLDLVYLRAGGEMGPDHEESITTRFEALESMRQEGQRDDVDLLRACEAAAGIAFAPYFPLGGGMTDLANELISQVAHRRTASVPQIALAWLLATSPVTLAIPGTGSIAHLEQNIAAADIHLTDDGLAQLA